MKRSLRADVRNPLMAMPAAALIQELPDEARTALRCLLADIALDARARANECWRKHKAPMAAYWKAVSVYAGHAKKLCKERAA